jgi:hypothetical protein
MQNKCTARFLNLRVVDFARISSIYAGIIASELISKE